MSNKVWELHRGIGSRTERDCTSFADFCSPVASLNAQNFATKVIVNRFELECKYLKYL